MKDYSAFAEAERTGWTDGERAAGYINLFAAASDQIIEPLLDAVGVKSGESVLDFARARASTHPQATAYVSSISGSNVSICGLIFASRN